MKTLTNPSIDGYRGPSQPLSWLKLHANRFPFLTNSGIAMLIACMVALVLTQFDSRTVLGLNVWVKPAKFLFSVGVNLLTVSWLLTQFDQWNPGRMTRLSKWMAWLLNLEVALIVMQGARGVQSHYNIATPFDGIVFGVMGGLIGLATIIMGYLTWIAWTKPLNIRKPLLWAIRIGLLLFILASVQGGYMSQHFSHAVGVPDGGAGIPLFNWSTEGGDLRIAHFLGLHGLQLFPILAFMLRKQTRNMTPVIVAFGLMYSLFVMGTFAWAMMGRPMF